MTDHSNSNLNPEDFSLLALSQPLKDVIQELGLKSLTPIQAKSIPVILSGRDMIGQSKTGSGKTAAFTLPILEKVQLEGRVLQALILCPTRELCVQVAREMRKLGRRNFGLQVLPVSGGQPFYAQSASLEKGVHVVVGTPGRVLDHVNRGTLLLDRVKFLVLDEADRMLDMGFQEDMEKILRKVSKQRQTLLFSATFPKKIELLSKVSQKNPVRITIEEEKQNAPKIRQVVYEVDPAVKFNGLIWLLQQHKPESAIVFCNFKTSVIDLNRALVEAGVSAACLHGDMEQSERDRVMAKFRNQSTRVLIATDVAARGIDIENLDAVFNFELPAQPDIYVHRIGRTGRAGKEGVAVSFVTSREKSKIQAIEKYTGAQLIPKTLARVESLNLDEFRKNIDQTAKMQTLYISGGRKEKMRPGDILGALTGEAGGLKGAHIGKIEIHDHFSYVAVSRAVSNLAAQRLRDGRIKGRKFRVDLVR